MAQLIPVQRMTGGITQQPALVTAPDKLRDSLNVYPLPEAGLVRRPGTRYIARVADADPTPEVGLIPINFGGFERYLAVVQHDLIRVFLKNGTEIDLYSVTRDANGSLTGGALQNDFTYINLRRSNGIATDAESIKNIAVGGTWTPGTGALAPSYPETTRSPLGWRDDTLVAALNNFGYYPNLRVDPTAATSTSYAHSVDGNLFKGIRSMSIFVSTNGAAPLIDDIGLKLTDPAEEFPAATPRVRDFEVVWSFGGDPASVPTVVSNPQNLQVFAEKLPISGNHYRLGWIWDPNDDPSPPDVSGDALTAEILLQDYGAIGPDRNLEVWGCLVGHHHLKTELPSYTLPPEVLRTTDAGGTVFIANPRVQTRLDTGTSSPGFSASYSSTAFTIHAGGSTTHNIASAGYIFVKSGADSFLSTSTDFLTNIKVTDGTITNTIVSGPLGVAATDGSDAVATKLAAAINAATGAGQNHDGDGTPENIVQAFAKGSVVLLVSKDDAVATKTWTITSITHWDTGGDQLMSAYIDEVDDVTDLARIGVNGHVIKVFEDRDDANSVKDDFRIPQRVLRFQSDTGANGDPANDIMEKGRWVEGTDYDIAIDVDPVTLPHILRRITDDAVGTVTGNQKTLLFEYQPHTWDSRVVGDDISNPRPSFLTSQFSEGVDDRFVSAVDFYRGRLVLASGLNIAFSEVNAFGSFWRTTLKSLADSDPVDVLLSTPDSSSTTDLISGLGRLLLRSDRSILAVAPAEVFGPRSIGMDSVFGDGTGALAQGLIASGGLFLPGDGDDHGGVVFLFPGSRGLVGDETPRFDQFDVSAEVSKLLPQPVAGMTWAWPLRSLFVWSREDKSRIFGCRFVPQERQVAWFPIDMDGSDIHAAAAISGELYLLVDRDDGVYLEAMKLDEFPVDEGQDWMVHLDRRVTELDLPAGSITYAGGPDETSIVLPYAPRSGATVMVCHRDGADFGVSIPVIDVTGSTVKVSGDFTGQKLVIGETFTSEAELLRPVLRNSDGSPVTDIVLVRDGEVMVSESGYAQVVVVDTQGVERTVTVDNETASAVALRDSRIPFVVGVEDVDTVVKIRNATQKPTNIVGMEWRVDVEHSGERGR